MYKGENNVIIVDVRLGCIYIERKRNFSLIFAAILYEQHLKNI